MASTKKKILITGGFGYLGGRITQSLLSSGLYEVIVCTRKIKTNFYSGLLDAQKFEIDFNKEDNLTQCCEGVDTIVHLSAPNELDAFKNPKQTLIDTCFNSVNLLTAAEKCKVNKFIYFSTAHVYGSPLQGKINELSLPKPSHPYSIAHRAAEDFVNSFQLKNKIAVSILRLSNSFGAPITKHINRWTLLTNDLCKQAIINRELVLMSSGSQLRDFIPIIDIENCISHLIYLEKESFNGQIFNLGGKKTLSILSMAHLIAKRCEILFHFKPTIKVMNESQKKEQLPEFNYDISKLESTGFVLSDSFNKEIDSTLIFCKNNFMINDNVNPY